MLSHADRAMNRARLHPVAPLAAASRAISVVACALCAVGLAACGGGGEESDVGGTVSGLSAGASVTVRNNGEDTLTLTANGPFHFPIFVPAGNPYSVVIVTQPAGQSCTITNASGLLDGAADPVSNVAVTCTTT